MLSLTLEHQTIASFRYIWDRFSAVPFRVLLGPVLYGTKKEKKWIFQGSAQSDYRPHRTGIG